MNFEIRSSNCTRAGFESMMIYRNFALGDLRTSVCDRKQTSGKTLPVLDRVMLNIHTMIELRIRIHIVMTIMKQSFKIQYILVRVKNKQTSSVVVCYETSTS